MTSTTKLFDLAELTEAAYADFTGINVSSSLAASVGRTRLQCAVFNNSP